MENKRYGGSAETREEALDCAMEELKKNILSLTEKCNRAFRIYEDGATFEYYKGYREYANGSETYFKIEEIPVNYTNFVVNTDYRHLEYPIKYNFKERIKILLKGRI